MIEWVQRCMMLPPLPQRDGAVDARSFAATAAGEELRAEGLRCLHAIFQASVPHAFCRRVHDDERTPGMVVSRAVKADEVRAWLAEQGDAACAEEPSALLGATIQRD